jgi:hypothetical protein
MGKAVVVLVLLVAGCAVYRPMPRGDVVIRTEFDAPGMSADRIFEKSKTWLTRHLYSDKQIIAYADRKAGVIIANGTVPYTATGELESIDRIQYTISFTVREEIRDAKISLTFDNLLLNVPRYYQRSRFRPEMEYVGGYSVPITQRSDFEAARKGALEIAAKLADHLKE